MILLDESGKNNFMWSVITLVLRPLNKFITTTPCSPQ